MTLELNHLYHGDCLNFMKEMPDKSVDLVLTDPPYGIGVNHNMGRRHGDKPSEYSPAIWDTQSPPNVYFDELFRISKDQIIFGANHFISKIPFNSSCWIVWDKGFSEDISFAQVELAWTSFTSTSKKIECSSKRIDGCHHPTQKPLPLMMWCLEKYSKPGMTVLDPFMGSGTTCVACKKLGRNYIGIEKEVAYIEIAKKRLERVNNHKISEWGLGGTE